MVGEFLKNLAESLLLCGQHAHEFHPELPITAPLYTGLVDPQWRLQVRHMDEELHTTAERDT